MIFSNLHIYLDYRFLNTTAIQNQDKDGNLASIPQMEGKKTQKRSYSRCVTVTNEKSFFDCMVFVLKDRVVDHA